jgi:hypothetical protein
VVERAVLQHQHHDVVDLVELAHIFYSAPMLVFRNPGTSLSRDVRVQPTA